jgi:hypothetical protein
MQCDCVRHDLALEAHDLVSRNSGKPALVDVVIDRNVKCAGTMNQTMHK